MMFSSLPFSSLQECLSVMIVEMEDIFLKLADSEDILEARVTLESFQRGLGGMGVSLGEEKRERGRKGWKKERKEGRREGGREGGRKGGREG